MKRKPGLCCYGCTLPYLLKLINSKYFSHLPLLLPVFNVRNLLAVIACSESLITAGVCVCVCVFIHACIHIDNIAKALETFYNVILTYRAVKSNSPGNKGEQDGEEADVGVHDGEMFVQYPPPSHWIPALHHLPCFSGYLMSSLMLLWAIYCIEETDVAWTLVMCHWLELPCLLCSWG